MHPLPLSLALRDSQISGTPLTRLETGVSPPDVVAKLHEARRIGAQSSARTKLWNLPQHLWCSIIGTCLSTEELRKLVIRCSGLRSKVLSDLAIHEEGVQLAAHAEPGGRVLQKTLDRRYYLTVKKFDKAKTAPEVAWLWEEAKQRGEIPGAYWAALTHRAVTVDLLQTAFGDVHMLSHLVGAANRADIRRLTALASHNAELETRIERQQARLRDAIVSRDETIKHLREQLAEHIAQRESPLSTIATSEGGEVQTLRELIASLRHRLATDALSRERAELLAQRTTNALTRAEAELRGAREREEEMQAELERAERQLAALATPVGEAPDSIQVLVEGCTIVYIGGRPGPVVAMRSLVERGNGQFVHHDGGIEDRRGLIASAISKADLVLFPVDCVSHDAVFNLKRLCRQAGKPFQALRTSSIASFVTALVTGIGERADSPEADLVPPSRSFAPHFCLRHG